MNDDDRETLSIKPKGQSTREQIARADWEKLFLDKSFLRVVFTILKTAGMFTGNFQPVERTHAFLEGRRSLGFDILRTAEKYLGPDALLRILEAESSTLKEAPSGRRTDYPDRRTDELGSVDNDVRQPGTGLVFLDYAGPGEGAGG
jgi:hypothetical protein